MEVHRLAFSNVRYEVKDPFRIEHRHNGLSPI
jgi:hypothetical protein